MKMNIKEINKAVMVVVFGLISLWGLFEMNVLQNSEWMIACLLGLYFMYQSSRGN